MNPLSFEFKSITLFEFLLEFSLNEEHIDLHNDYICTKLIIENSTSTFCFSHCHLKKFLQIRFEDCIIKKMSLSFSKLNGLTLENLHRGRYENEGKLYDEFEGRTCYYLEFCDNGEVELLCGAIKLEIQ